MVLQPVLSPEGALAEEPWSLQLCFCRLVLPAGSREHPDLWMQMGKERSCASPPDATSLCKPSFPPLLRRGSSACDYAEAGEVGSRARPGPSLCCRGHWLQQVQPSSPFVSHVTAVGEIEPSGKATEGKCSEKTDVQVLPVWDQSPQPHPFLSESIGNK